MNLDGNQTETGQSSKLASDICYVEYDNGFKDICRRGVGAVVMNCPPLPGFQQWIDGLAPEFLPSLRAIVPVENSAETIGAACNSARMPADDNRQHLISDATMLARAFAALMNVTHLRIRLDVVNDNACCLFHQDQVPARLICAYRGRGTQYGLWRPDADPEPVFDVPTGSPIVLRGALWDDDQPSGIVHRSPPVESSGKTRLVFVLDPIKDPMLDY